MADIIGIKLPNFAKYIAEIEKDYKRREQILKQRVMKAAQILQKEAARNVPVERHGPTAAERIGGRLRASIKAEIEQRGSEVTGAVGTNLKYGVYTEFGTKAHTIRPKRAKALRWFDGDEAIFAKEARHPGIEVGTPESPRTSWKALRKRGGSGQKMPWLRSAFLKVKERMIEVISEPYK